MPIDIGDLHSPTLRSDRPIWNLLPAQTGFPSAVIDNRDREPLSHPAIPIAVVPSATDRELQVQRTSSTDFPLVDNFECLMRGSR